MWPSEPSTSSASCFFESASNVPTSTTTPSRWNTAPSSITCASLRLLTLQMTYLPRTREDGMGLPLDEISFEYTGLDETTDLVRRAARCSARCLRAISGEAGPPGGAVRPGQRHRRSRALREPAALGSAGTADRGRQPRRR